MTILFISRERRAIFWDCNPDVFLHVFQLENIIVFSQRLTAQKRFYSPIRPGSPFFVGFPALMSIIINRLSQQS